MHCCKPLSNYELRLGWKRRTPAVLDSISLALEHRAHFLPPTQHRFPLSPLSLSVFALRKPSCSRAGVSRRIRAHGLRDWIHRAHARKTDSQRVCASSLRFPGDISAFNRGVIGLWTDFPPTVSDSCTRAHQHIYAQTHAPNHRRRHADMHTHTYTQTRTYTQAHLHTHSISPSFKNSVQGRNSCSNRPNVFARGRSQDDVSGLYFLWTFRRG